MSTTDVITQEVIRARLDGIVREMQAAVLRTGFSTIIRESHDFSAGITDVSGAVVGQYSPLPTHLGAYPDCVQGVLEFYSLNEMQEGDCYLANHPYYSGCPHPNDMVVVLPVFHEGEVIAFCASMGHKADIGGQSPGSRNTIARDVFGDGLQIMPVLFQRSGEMNKEVAQFLRANSRTPELVIGDLGAQAGALRSIGAGRVKTLANEYGGETLTAAFGDIVERVEARVRSHFAEWADSVAEAEAWVDDIVDPSTTIRLHVAAIKQGNCLTLDFSGSGDQSAGPINVRPPFIRGMAYFAAIAMMDPSVPNNGGLARAVECRFREGSIMSPRFPRPSGVLLDDDGRDRGRGVRGDEQGVGTPRRRAQRSLLDGRARHVRRRPRSVRAVRVAARGQRRVHRRRRLHRHGPFLGRWRQVHQRRDTRIRVRRGVAAVHAHP